VIAVLSELDTYRYHGVSCVRNASLLSKSDEKELLFWSTDPLESPYGDLFDNLVQKADFIKVFDKVMPRLELTGKETILELGGGHCWASAMVKRNHPNCYVVASDLSPDAVRFLEKYEGILRVLVDEKWAFNSRQIPFEKEQFDRIFTFATFHHFGENNDFGAVIREMLRVLQPAGKIVLLYEPSSSQWLYERAFERVNRKRAAFSHTIDEDVLVLSKIKRICDELGCRCKAQYFTSYEERSGIVETVYYYTLTRLKPLRWLLPCTVNLEIEKT
jgi:SAM-dependent methyltransferase